MKGVFSRTTCRGCGSHKLHKIIDLGCVPLAGGFLKISEIESELKIPLDVFFCEECCLAQITNIVEPEILFKNYFYISSVIPQLALHFKEYAVFLEKKYLSHSGAKLLEMGCNDGVLLQNFVGNKNIFSLGVEPSLNVSKLSKDKGINVINDFFSLKSSEDIKKRYGNFDVITGSNMFAHIDNIIDVIHGVKNLLNKNGVFIFEVHYLLDLLKDFQYDTIYHEHLTYYSIIAVKKIFELQNMKVIDVYHLDMHGGGIRVVVANNDSYRDISENVADFIEKEKQFGLDKLEVFKDFGNQVIEHKKQLIKLLDNLKSEGKSIVGYGAPGRGTILLNYCGIDKKYLDYIVDISPLKKGMLMPGVHIDIVDPIYARENPPDYFLVLAWNYIGSILDQEKVLFNQGTKFIIPFPKINIIE